ncbi:hypothetical protein QAD02_014025 [Eretmocerus hayati]|uniref:Uncharacterized protein n=1 Tax=Eretmocerus hayati TaxID=131215 RepID=A0ACC2P559_9HYME|nr:hypothetical protein QAD02_014025 [Eretmocerus hayati]
MNFIFDESVASELQSVTPQADDSLQVLSPSQDSTSLHQIEVSTSETSAAPIQDSESTTPISRPALATISSDNIANRFAQFEIPWMKLSTATLEKLDQGLKSDKITTDIVHMVIAELRVISKHIEFETLRGVARKIITKYPALEDKMNDGVTRSGEGIESLSEKLKLHNIYLNRTRDRANPLSEVVHISKRRFNQSVFTGCTNPEPELPTISDETMARYIEKLRSCGDDEIPTDSLEAFKITYPLQRKLLNTFPHIDLIKNEWPCLLKKPYLFIHFKELTGHEITMLKDEFESANCAKLLKWGFFKKHIEAIKDTSTCEQKFWSVAQTLCSRFKETLSKMFTFYPANADKDKIQAHTDDPQLVVIFGSATEIDTDVLLWKSLMNDQSKSYWFHIDKKHILSENEPIVAMQLLMSVYYVYNKTYPTDAACFLLYMQMRFLDIHGVGPTKSRKRSTARRVSPSPTPYTHSCKGENESSFQVQSRFAKNY